MQATRLQPQWVSLSDDDDISMGYTQRNIKFSVYIGQVTIINSSLWPLTTLFKVSHFDK